MALMSSAKDSPLSTSSAAFQCDFLCGFAGSFEMVSAHEANCALNPAISSDVSTNMHVVTCTHSTRTHMKEHLRTSRFEQLEKAGRQTPPGKVLEHHLPSPRSFTVPRLNKPAEQVCELCRKLMPPLTTVHEQVEAGVGLSFERSPTTGWYYVIKMESEGPAESCGSIQLMDELITIDTVSVNPKINSNVSLEEINDLMVGPLGSQIMLSFRRKNMGKLSTSSRTKAEGAEDFYAVRLTRSLVINKATYIAPMVLRYVFMEEKKFDIDIEVKSEVVGKKTTFDMLSKAMRREIINQGQTWASCGEKFLEWRDLHRAKMRTKMKFQQVNRLLDRMCLKRSLMLWIEWCFEDRLQKQLGLQSDNQMRMKPMLKSFLEWRDVSREAKSRQKKLRKTVQRILRRTLVLAFDNWKESPLQERSEEERRQVLMKLCLAGIMKRCLAVCMVSWAILTKQQLRQWALIKRAAMLMTGNLMAAAWGRWYEQIEQERIRKVVMVRVVMRISKRCLVVCLESWAALTSERMWERNVLRRVAQRRTGSVMAAVWEKWCAAIDQQSQETAAEEAEQRRWKQAVNRQQLVNELQQQVLHEQKEREKLEALQEQQKQFAAMSAAEASARDLELRNLVRTQVMRVQQAETDLGIRREKAETDLAVMHAVSERNRELITKAEDEQRVFDAQRLQLKQELEEARAKKALQENDLHLVLQECIIASDLARILQESLVRDAAACQESKDEMEHALRLTKARLNAELAHRPYNRYR